MRFGCVADDFTGAADVASVLTRRGARTVVLIGVPSATTALPSDTDAVVVALPVRTAATDRATATARYAGRWLIEHGAARLYSKYCSTFDSTDAGNIGPIADALCEVTGAAIAVVCPSYPANGRTVSGGRLFVDGWPLEQTGMRHHPLTPMTESDLVVLLGRQTPWPVGLVPLDAVRSGAGAVAARIAELAGDGVRYAVCDAETDADLASIARAVAGHRLATGGAALAGEWLGDAGGGGDVGTESLPTGAGVVIAGSCSEATRRQVARFALQHPTVSLDPRALADGFDPVPLVTAFAQAHDGPILVGTTATPEEVAATQAALGRERAAELIETSLGRCAVALRERGVHRFVVAGGETAGAVVGALGVTALRVVADVDPGVPVTVSLGPEPLSLVLKSGNFGGPDLFVRALA